MTKSDFFSGVFLSSHALKLLAGSIIPLCMLGLGFVASLAIIRVIHDYRKFKISIAIPK